MSIQCHACIGGTNVGEDIRKLDYGQHIVSGTPGRVFDMIKRRNLRTRNIKMLVLDEADEMLNKGQQHTPPVILENVFILHCCTCVCMLWLFIGFKEQIYDVYRYLPPATQVFMPLQLQYIPPYILSLSLSLSLLHLFVWLIEGRWCW